MTDTSAANGTQDISAPTPTEQPPLPHQQQSFLATADAFIKGKDKPKHDASGPIVEDLRAAAAEQDDIRKQLQKISETAQQAQAALMQAQGKADALLQVLHRLEAAAK